ncbi:hypothetical protein OC845_005971 [Tilletia horrida]|nr:hypothetical protein OC845_005971 [Tilletia horrida]
MKLSNGKTWAAKFAAAAILLQFTTLAIASPADASYTDVSFAPRAGSIAPNQNCAQDTDCASAVCLTTTLKGDCDRLNATGSAVDCSKSGSPYCQGFPLGHKCANQGECRDGLCSKKGICVKTAVGQACNDNLGCSGNQVCRDRKCFEPAAGSLYPTSSCKVDASCVSGRCVTEIGQDTGYLGPYPVPTRLSCDYFALDQAGCRNTHDCQSGICKNGTCQIGLDGDRCLINDDCVNVCGLDGICSSPANNSLTQDEPCKADSQCVSSACSRPTFFLFFGTSRPDPSTPGRNFTYYLDETCEGVLFGGKCGASNDCAQGYCVDGKCKGTALGSSCTENKSCKSMTCIKGKCVTGGAYAPCTSNSACFSKSCYTDNCGQSQRICPQPHCQPIAINNKCRVKGDCEELFYDCINGTCQMNN